ncbi:hypothetical protein [Jeongeupia naejangsanensis]|uniref:Uncharacterized protein n=1 Tax=Jeongeupia naejangsanensis TaxID=613195 RepID=A0ABS2BGS5_9NEIS|nr:hypothetical protein [Jeongeupia naejangsanensis]MBM3114806.1 hypothetical protein [Jeongeupia naejangsanensis]
MRSKLGQESDRTLFNALGLAIDYVTKNKVVWKVVNDVVVRGGLDEYSDAQEIKYMHQVIVGLNEHKFQ